MQPKKKQFQPATGVAHSAHRLHHGGQLSVNERALRSLRNRKCTLRFLRRLSSLALRYHDFLNAWNGTSDIHKTQVRRFLRRVVQSNIGAPIRFDETSDMAISKPKTKPS